MSSCKVCLDINPNLYPPSQSIEIDFSWLEASAARGCRTCAILRTSIEVVGKDVLRPARGIVDFPRPDLVEISIRSGRSLSLHVRSLNEETVSKNYDLDLDLYTTPGIHPHIR